MQSAEVKDGGSVWLRHKVCKGADFSHEMEIPFDGTGDAELVTADEMIEA